MPAVYFATDSEHIMPSSSWQRGDDLVLEHRAEWKNVNDHRIILTSSGQSQSSSCSSVSSPSACSPKQRQQPLQQQVDKHKHSTLTFSPIIKVREIPHLEQFSDQEFFDVYYGAHDYERFELNVHQTVAQHLEMEGNSNHDGSFVIEEANIDDYDCLRGCEFGIPSNLQHCGRLIRDTQTAVQMELEHQRRDRSDECHSFRYDDERIRMVCQWYSKSSISKARRRASKDVKEVQECHVHSEQEETEEMHWFEYSNGSLESVLSQATS